jgi:hypothetical protein
LTINRTYEDLLRRLEENLNYINNAARERNNLNVVELNNAFFVARARLAAIGYQLAHHNPHPPVLLDMQALPPPPEQEFDENEMPNINDNVDDDEEDADEAQNEINPANLENGAAGAIDEINDEVEEFDDSDSEDLINEESDDEDPVNTGLFSLSDLHILQLDGDFI